MAETLDEFARTVENSVSEFVEKYKQKAKEEPEFYPLTMEDGNEGLWVEFYMGYLLDGTI